MENQISKLVSTPTATTEAVAEAIREHELSAKDWDYCEEAVRLNTLYDQLNQEFFSNRLPKAVLSIGPDLILRYGYYQIGRDAIGARYRIHLNSRHFGRSESDAAVTVLHEMLHVYQHLHGTLGKRARYHNAEFVRLAASAGIEAEIGTGRTKAVSETLREKLRNVGFLEARQLIPGMEAVPIQRPLKKVLWRCSCDQEVWVDQGVQPDLICRLCETGFERTPRQTSGSQSNCVSLSSAHSLKPSFASDEAGRGTNMANDANKPTKKFAAGGVSAALWKNTTRLKDGSSIETTSVTLDRRYKDKDGQWQSTGSLRLNDVPKAVLVLNQAYEFMLAKDTDGNAETPVEEIVV